MSIGFIIIHCLCCICSLDLNYFLANFDTISQLYWSFDQTLNYDPVREAALQNLVVAETNGSHTNSSWGGPSQPQGGGGENPSTGGMNSDTDTKRLADYLCQCRKGISLYTCGVEDTQNTVITSPERLYFSRIWSHVRTEYPEFAYGYPHTRGTTPNTDTLINNIYSLNKNYPRNWPYNNI
jgi:hypothetical protein